MVQMPNYFNKLDYVMLFLGDFLEGLFVRA